MNKKILSKITFIIVIVLSLTILYIKIFSKEFKPFGISILQVSSNSMLPKFEKGDLIITKEENEYKIGDIITYRTNKYLITHRIIGKCENGFITKGDNNNKEDEKMVKQEQIYGKVIYIIK